MESDEFIGVGIAFIFVLVIWFFVSALILYCATHFITCVVFSWNNTLWFMVVNLLYSSGSRSSRRET